jgi:hypothetical protein
VHISNCFAQRPRLDLSHFLIVWDAAFISALVAEDEDFWSCNKELRGRHSRAGMAKAMDDSVYIIEVLPDEASDASVLGDRLISSVRGFIS